MKNIQWLNFSQLCVKIFHFTDLSNDQKYLYQMCQAVSNGICAEDLAMRKPGPLVHFRWLTMTSRLLRLYVATESFSENLITLSHTLLKSMLPFGLALSLILNAVKHHAMCGDWSTFLGIWILNIRQ